MLSLTRKNQDDQLRDYLMKKTDPSEAYIETTWEKVQAQLVSERVEKPRMKKWRAVLIAAAVLLISVVWAGLSTATGQAIIQDIKKMFVKEKDVELEIEGMKEDVHVHVETNKELDYVIYIDESRYKMVKGEGTDRIIPNPPIGDDYPEVVMEITRIEGATREAKMAQIKQEIASEQMEIRQEEKTNVPIEGIVIRAIGKGDSQWDTPIYRYYITETQQDQFYVIKQLYFLEAAEGHGTRFDAMLDSFEIITEE